VQSRHGHDVRTQARSGNAACLSDSAVGVDTMPLLLAIEPDARQAACLTALGSAGLSTGHEQQPGVPTLTIPPFTSTTSSTTGGLLARLRRPRRRRGVQDCDPAAFATQIIECLALAHAAWLDLEPYLDDEARPVVRTGVRAADGVPEPDLIELPPPDELWAQLAPSDAARMAPLEGPSMTPRPLRAATPARDAEFETTEGASRSLQLVPAPSGSERPTQDEWGLYDPEQCGFAALLVRLDELADDDRRDRERSNRSAIMRR